ncbi:MAG: efflux RND transporter permease subunit [Steroidobacteraceae bacterium]|jgi:multidrug efflux pump subunit AcrB|nr:efflux RND transporter permease subunit [Steroidobacteraceae bacterium]
MFDGIIRHGTLLAVAVLVFCVLAVAAALRMPVQMIPDLEIRTVTVDTDWPGATPQDIEKEILIEQERFLRTVPNLRRMVSSAETGRATIRLEFPFGVDINDALIRVNNALSQVPAYPENTDEPRLSTSSFSENPFMFYRLIARDGNPLGLDLNRMQDFAEDYIRPRMERVPGVSRVDVGGGAPREVRIEVDAARLAERGITLLELREAVRARNRDASGGDIDSGKRRYLVRTLGRFETVEDVENLILSRRGDSITRLADVATVNLGHAELRSIAFTAGQRTLNLSVRREAGSNVIAIKRAMGSVVEDLNRNLLDRSGLELRLVSDDVRYVEESVGNVFRNLALGAALATFVMYLFLRSGPATLVGVLGIPLSTLAAFVGLLVFGRTINVISLAGIAFAIGMTVDNTIVVLENIERLRRTGMARLQATVAGVREVWPAVLASTLTTVIVFAPILFVEQEAGQLFSDIAIAISAAIIASMAVAISVVPATIARLGFSGKAAERRDSRLHLWLLAQVDRLLASRALRRVAAFGLPVALLALVAALVPPAEYLPEGEEPKVFARMIAPPGYNIAEMHRIATPINAELAELVDADPASFDRGESRFPPLATVNLNVSARSLFVVAEPVRPRDVDALMDAFNERFREEPGMRAFASRGSIISSNDGGTRSVNIDIAGQDLAELYAAADGAFRAAEEIFERPQVNSDPSSLSLDQPLLEIRPDWERLAELGFNAQGFGFAVAALSDGAFVDEFVLGDEKIDIRLYSEAGSSQDIDALRRLPVAAPNGAVLPLESLARLDDTVDTDAIRRVDGRRTVTVSIVPPPDVALETAVGVVESQLLPRLSAERLVTPGMTLEVSGAADQLDETRRSLGANFLLATALSYLLLVAVFRHWGWPLLILVTVPLGLAGGILGLALMNGVGIRLPFDMITMLGFLILLGTVVNNPILVVDRTRELLRDGAVTAVEAVRQAVASRLRPILMTTLTTAFGLAPLVLIPGAGTELYRGLGVVVLSGLVCSTVISLTALPALLVELLKWRERFAPARVAG